MCIYRASLPNFFISWLSLEDTADNIPCYESKSSNSSTTSYSSRTQKPMKRAEARGGRGPFQLHTLIPTDINIYISKYTYILPRLQKGKLLKKKGGAKAIGANRLQMAAHHFFSLLPIQSPPFLPPSPSTSLLLFIITLIRIRADVEVQ